MEQTNLERFLTRNAHDIATIIVGNRACEFCIYKWGYCHQQEQKISCVDGIEEYLKSTNPDEHYLKKSSKEIAEQTLKYIESGLYKQEGTKTERRRDKKSSNLLLRGI